MSELSVVALALLRLAESIAVVTPSKKDNIIIATIKEFFRFG